LKVKPISLTLSEGSCHLTFISKVWVAVKFIRERKENKISLKLKGRVQKISQTLLTNFVNGFDEISSEFHATQKISYINGTKEH
jgi:hypothetical protein